MRLRLQHGCQLDQETQKNRLYYLTILARLLTFWEFTTSGVADEMQVTLSVHHQVNAMELVECKPLSWLPNQAAEEREQRAVS